MTGEEFLNAVANGRADILRLLEANPALENDLPPGVREKLG